MVLCGDPPPGYKKVGASGLSLLGQTDKWDFNNQDVFEGVIVNRREQRSELGNFMVYEVIHLNSGVGYAIFGSSVLDERFADVPDFAKIYIKFVGVPKGKRYKNYDFFVDTDYVFDPNAFPKYTEKIVEHLNKKKGFPEINKPQGFNAPSNGVAPPSQESEKITPPAKQEQAPIDNTANTEYEEPPF